MKKTIIIISLTLLISFYNVNAKGIEIYFNANGGNVNTSDFNIDNYNRINYSNSDYFAKYKENGTIKNLNTINNKLFTITKTNTKLVKEREWYYRNSFDNKIYYFSNSNQYKVNNIIRKLNLDNQYEDDYYQLEFYANWENNKVNGGRDFPKSPTSIKIKNNGSDTIIKGKKTDLDAVYLPTDSVEEKVTWTSSDKKIATVNKNGKVKAKKKGKVKIKAKTTNGLKNEITLNITTKEDINKNHLTIKYNTNGGKGCTKSLIIKGSNIYSSLCTPKRDGYVFSGWYTKKKGGSKVEEGNTLKSNNNHTIYAHWKKWVGSLYFFNTPSESVLIRSDDGHYLLLDNSNKINNKDNCSKLVNKIRNVIEKNKDEDDIDQMKIDTMILSHNHGDHVGCTNYILNNFTIDNIILKGFTSKRYKKDSEDKKFETLKKSSGKVVDTLDSTTYDNMKNSEITNSNNNLEFTLGKNNTTKVHIFNYNDAFSGKSKNCKKKIIDMRFVALTKSTMAKNLKYMARYKKKDSNKYYYLDGINSKHLKIATEKKLNKMLEKGIYDKNGIYRYYVPKFSYRKACNENTNALAILLEFKTKKGSKYAYLPSDLGNNGVSFMGKKETIEGYSGRVTDTGNSFAVKLAGKTDATIQKHKPKASKYIKNPVLKTKKVKNSKKYYPIIGERNIEVLAESETAIAVKEVIENNGTSTSDILVYQPSHHGYNNDMFASKVLNLNNPKIYHIISSNEWSGTDKKGHVQRTNFVISNIPMKNNHFSFPGKKQSGNNSYIKLNFTLDGKIQFTGKAFNCGASTKSCK